MTKSWKTISGEIIQSDFPPNKKFKILINNSIIFVAPFKAHTSVTNNDLLPLIEQKNFTNKYLQTI